MKAWDIIKCIKEVDDVRATQLLETLFISGYIKGVSRGYDNVKKPPDVLNTDVKEAKQAFKEKYL